MPDKGFVSTILRLAPEYLAYEQPHRVNVLIGSALPVIETIRAAGLAVHGASQRALARCATDTGTASLTQRVLRTTTWTIRVRMLPCEPGRDQLLATSCARARRFDAPRSRRWCTT